ncbi:MULTISPECIES: hypothetical protein [unclassified Streptomyces]|uniref:hypothetical protein n=1 Tax=unclassified Streptomyces TaxID=2593676 RepID=UPI0036F9328F
MGHQSYDITVTTFDGELAFVVQPAIPDAAPAALKDGLAVRRAANVHGWCPDCGARPQMPNRRQRRALVRAGKVIPALFFHEDGCACLTDDEGGAE